MRKGLIYGALMLAAVAVPKERVELGQLRPVETLCVSRLDSRICLQTDLGDMGVGANIHEAALDLKESAPGAVYLDTANYLIVPEAEGRWIRELSGYLKGRVRLCVGEGDIPADKVTRYLAAHRPDIRLKDWEMGMKPEVLRVEHGSYQLFEK